MVQGWGRDGGVMARRGGEGEVVVSGVVCFSFFFFFFSFSDNGLFIAFILLF